MYPCTSLRVLCLHLVSVGRVDLFPERAPEELTYLTRRQAIPAIALAHVIIAIVMVLNGTVGARLHVPFPVLNRSSFGFWFSYFSVVSRAVLAMFWFGILTFTGKICPVNSYIKAN
jgi:cytosine/uracil/thiamine/allantoin permease